MAYLSSKTIKLIMRSARFSGSTGQDDEKMEIGWQKRKALVVHRYTIAQ